MWNSSSEPVGNGRGIRVVVELDSSPVSFADVLRMWQSDQGFRSFFIGLLAESPFPAFRWETPPITTVTAGRSFEFVILDSPSLARKKPDANAFAEYFTGAGETDVVEFLNLGQDAILIVPYPNAPVSVYGHIGVFVREAPKSQIHALWQLVGSVMQRRVGIKPVWLSTAGAGVPWLHVRLDDRPKYYGYVPYQRSS